jgi:HEAT repeat protein
LFEALKDENWRIRKEAVTTAGKTGNKEFLDILFYRSDNDPVEDIKNESLKSIAEIGGADAFDFIREKAENPRINPKTRIQAFTIAVTKDLSGSLEMIDSQLEKEWNAAVKTLLENFCSELSKITSNQLDQYFEKMLYHPSVVVKVSGLRGIRLNRIARLKEKVKEISEDKRQPLSVRNNALAALEQL